MSRQPRAMWPFVLILGVLFVLSVTAPRSWEAATPRRAPRRGTLSVGPPVVKAGSPQASALRPRRIDWRTEMVAAPDLLPRESRQEPDALPVLRLHRPASLATQVAPPPPQPRGQRSRPSGKVTRQHAQAWLELALRPLDRSLLDWQVPRLLPRAWPSRLSRTLHVRRPAEPSLWRPEALLSQLERLECECDAAPWAGRAAELVRELSRTSGPDGQRLSQSLAELQALLAQASAAPSAEAATSVAADSRRARHALQRRLDLWDLLATAPAWRQQELAFAGAGGLSPSLFYLAGARPAPADILRHVEEFESEALPSQARELAATSRRLAWTDQDGGRWESWLDQNYRNSNLRLVVSAELLNRLVPEQPAQDAPVRDRILGAVTRGRSHTTTRLSVRPMPAHDRWRIALEAKGDVFARTTSRSGPATFFSDSDGRFLASKVLEIGPAGIEAQPSQATATNSPRLRGVKTEFDSVPLVGSLVERIARSRHDESKPVARRIAGRKIRARVETQLDAEVDAKLAKARQILQDRVSAPLGQLALEPSVVQMQTTDSRLTLRLRLAGDEQLAAHTPRPRAPADSLASVQVHQSLVNNMCEQLNLGGRTLTLPELQTELMHALKLPPEVFREPFPDDMKVTFAAHDALRTRFVDGRLELTMVFAELRRYPRSWRNFTIRVYYQPQADASGLRLVRAGAVQLTGDRFSGQPQIVLRGIFSKIFAPDRKLELIQLAGDSPLPLAGLNVTQCEITDGWIAIALGRAPSVATRPAGKQR